MNCSFAVVSCGIESWYLIITEQHNIDGNTKQLLRTICVPKRQQRKRERGKLHIDQLHDLHCFIGYN
jgi:hypothetical protein